MRQRATEQHFETMLERSQNGGMLSGWWSLTAPPAPPAKSSFAERDRARQGRFASTILLTLLILNLLSLPAALITSASVIPIGFLGGVCLVALALNRQGQVMAASVFAGLACVGALAISGLLFPPASYELIWLFIIPEVIIVSLIQPGAVFPLLCLDTLLSAILITHASGAHPLSPLAILSVLAPPAFTRVFVALVAFLGVRSRLSVARQAEQAKEILALQEREARYKRELEDGMRQLLGVLARVANGELDARAPLQRGALLFPLNAGSNMLITRLATAEAHEQRMREQARQLLIALAQLEQGETPAWPQLAGGALDSLIFTLRDLIQRRALGLPRATDPFMPPVQPPAPPYGALDTPNQADQPGLPSAPFRFPWEREERAAG